MIPLYSRIEGPITHPSQLIQHSLACIQDILEPHPIIVRFLAHEVYFSACACVHYFFALMYGLRLTDVTGQAEAIRFIPCYMRGVLALELIRSCLHYFHVTRAFAPLLARSMRSLHQELASFLRINLPMSRASFQNFVAEVRSLSSPASFSNFMPEQSRSLSPSRDSSTYHGATIFRSFPIRGFTSHCGRARGVARLYRDRC